jgi:hypothetical protein
VHMQYTKRSSVAQLVNDIFGLGAESYPATPGFKRGGTSQAAADWRGRVLQFLVDNSSRDWLPDETAAKLGVSPFLIRPRFTELQSAGLIAKTGERRRNPGSTANANAFKPTELALTASMEDER